MRRSHAPRRAAASYAASLIVVRDDVPERTINVKSEGDEVVEAVEA